MINLITTLSTGCFDALNIRGGAYVYENNICIYSKYSTYSYFSKKQK